MSWPDSDRSNRSLVVLDHPAPRRSQRCLIAHLRGGLLPPHRDERVRLEAGLMPAPQLRRLFTIVQRRAIERLCDCSQFPEVPLQVPHAWRI